MRSILSIRFLSIRACVPAVFFLSAVVATVTPSFCQQTPPVSQPEVQQAPSQSTPAAQTPATPSPNTPPASKEPDYPDPRGITIGVFGLYNLPSIGPDIRGGAAASLSNTYENLPNIGQAYKIIPQFEFSIPVTRTGTIYAEFQRYHGWADQTISRDTFIDTYSFVPNDSIHTTYHIITSRIYLDDLLFPEKFPVPRLRFKSIWGIRYISVTQTVDSPTEDATAGLGGTSFELGTNYIFFPEFGAAVEYAMTPHTLFRVEAAGFGFPHHSNMADTAATLSYRKKNLEFLMGVKMLHFKTSPRKEEYEVGTFITPFVGVRWHW